MALPDLQLSAGGRGAAVRDQPPRALRAGDRPARARWRRRARGSSRSAPVGHLRSPVVFDDLNFAFREYDPFVAYGQSKTANVLFAVGATARWADDGITTNALQPGLIATHLQRHMDPSYIENARKPRATGSRRPSRALRPRSASRPRPELEGIGGRYFEDCAESPVVDRRPETGQVDRRRALRARPGQRRPAVGTVGALPGGARRVASPGGQVHPEEGCPHGAHLPIIMDMSLIPSPIWS